MTSTRLHEVVVGSGRLVVDDNGPLRSGHPPIILLHGFSFDRTMWHGDVEVLARRRRVIAYDLRGFGESSPPDPTRSHLDDLDAVVAASGAERVILIGLSLGANIALAYGTLMPDRVCGIVLVSSGLTGAVSSVKRPPEQAMTIAAANGSEAAKFFWRRHALFDTARRSVSVAARLDAMLDRYSGVHWTDAPTTIALPWMAERLSEVECAVLIINGADELPVYLDLGERLFSGISGAERVLIGGSGHVVNLENPTEFRRVVGDFVDRIDREIT